MLKLRDIMTRDVVTVSPDLSLRETMELLATKHLSGAPVVAGTKVIGVISATDLLSFAATLPGVPTERPELNEWGEWETPLEWEEGTEHSGGYFSELWSDVGAEVDERFREVSGPEWNALEEHTVAEAMSRRICSLPSDADVPKAADYMRRAGVHRLLVMDDNRLSGIVSTTDIARAVAQHRLTSRTYVFGRDQDFDERGEWRESPSGERNEWPQSASGEQESPAIEEEPRTDEQ